MNRRVLILYSIVFLTLTYSVAPIQARSSDVGALVMGPRPLQTPLQFTLEGMTRMSMMGMTEGSLGGWNENDWVPFRLTATNSGGNDARFEAAINMEYQNNGRIGIDAFADCFSASSPACGSGMTPMMGGVATGTGHMWSLSLGSSTGQTPAVSFSQEPGGVQTIKWDMPSVLVPAHSSMAIMWAVHLAKGGSTNLACEQGSPMYGCSPTTVPAGMGEASWPGRSLQVRAASPSIPGERTVSIDVSQQTQQTQPSCVIATAAYGSDLAAPVQFLRDFRDGLVQHTYLGSSFLSAFNNWYYSWAPSIAEQEANNNIMRSSVRVVILPLLGTLFLAQQIFSVLTLINSELAILIAGFIASTLIGATYLTPLTFILGRFAKRKLTGKTFFYAAILAALLALFGTLANGTTGAVEILTAIFVVECIILSPLALTRKLL